MEVYIEKARVMSDREGLAIYFESEASYLNNWLPKICTSGVNISTADTDQIYNMEKKIDTQTSQIATLNNKSGSSRICGSGVKSHRNFPIGIIKKF